MWIQTSGIALKGWEKYLPSMPKETQVLQALSFKNACSATNSTSQDIQVCCRYIFSIYLQWHNRRGGGQGGQSAPRDFWPGNFCWRIGKKEARKNGKLKKEGEKLQNEQRTFFFCFSLLKMTKICFGSTKMGIFYQEKTFQAGEKNQETCLLCYK